MALESTSLEYRGKQIFSLSESKNPDMDSAFFMSVHKSGSTLLNNMIRTCCERLNLDFVDIQSTFFNSGVPDGDIPGETSKIFKQKGYIYSGFRYFPHQYEIPCLKDCKVVLLIRDPRDAVVSQYFSLSKSHPLPGNDVGDEMRDQMIEARNKVLGMDINEFTIKEVGGFVNKLEAYSKLMSEHENIRLFQYEEIIYLKKKWLLSMAHFLDWKFKPGQPMAIASQFNVLPTQEDDTKHIRQVHPGNHISKLSPETIKEIDAAHSEILFRFNYL